MILQSKLLYVCHHKLLVINISTDRGSADPPLRGPPSPQIGGPRGGGPRRCRASWRVPVFGAKFGAKFGVVVDFVSPKFGVRCRLCVA